MGQEFRQRTGKVDWLVKYFEITFFYDPRGWKSKPFTMDFPLHGYQCTVEVSYCVSLFVYYKSVHGLFGYFLSCKFFIHTS